MIKRILPFVLVIAVLLSVMTMPVSAAETSGAYVELFDFVTANNTLNNTVTISTSGTASFDLSSTLGSLRAYHFELVFAFTGVQPASYALSFGSHALSVTQTSLGSGFVKLSGDAGGLAQSKFSLKVSNSGTSVLSFLSFVVYTVPDNRTNIAASVSANPGTSATLSPGGSVSVQASVGSTSVTDTSYNITVTESYWKSYDTIELRSSLYALGVQSVAAFTSTGDYLPTDVSYLGDGNTSFAAWYFISCSIDLTNIDSSYTGDIYIRVTALNNQSSGLYYVDGLQGVILSEPVDAQMKWYQILYRRINSGFSSVSNYLSNIFNWVRDGFSNLFEAMQTYWSTLFTKLSNGFTSVTDRLDSLINGTPVDEGVTNDMQQSEDELGNMTDQMDQVTPDLSADEVDVSTGSIPQDGSEGLAVGFFDLFWQSDYLVSMLTTVVAISMVSFVFFGKK